MNLKLELRLENLKKATSRLAAEFDLTPAGSFVQRKARGGCKRRSLVSYFK
jgi:hypothetical protein